MVIGGTKDAFFLFLGDIIFFIISLWLALAVRFGRIPFGYEFSNNLIAYVPVFLFWILVFYIVNLYSRQTMLFRRRLILGIIQAQLANVLVAAVYFYFAETLGISLGITPKTILLLSLIFSTILVLLWRLYVLGTIYRSEFIRTLLIGESGSVKKLHSIFSEYPEYRFAVAGYYPNIPASSDLSALAREHNAPVLIVDTSAYRNARTPGADTAALLFSGVRCIDAETLYEELSNRVSLSEIDDAWIIDVVSYQSKRAYTVLKRLMDIVIASALGLCSLLVYPFVMLAIKLDDRGDIFISQDRIGKNGKRIRLWKFRTMTTNDTNKPTLKNDSRVTRVGRFLRSSRLDELPQLWNVIQGRISLVGPRPELPHFVEEYIREIPYYHVRHAVPPGLSGWAQILFTEPAYNVENTKEKLAYDLYYVKNRSFLLDLKIALKTIKTLISRVGI